MSCIRGHLAQFQAKFDYNTAWWMHLQFTIDLDMLDSYPIGLYTTTHRGAVHLVSEPPIN